MKIFLRSLLLMLTPMVWLCTGLPGSGNSAGLEKGSQDSTRPSFEDVLTAHGVQQSLHEISSYKIEASRLTYTRPPSFFERKVTIAVQGAKFKRETAHPLGIKRQFELLDDGGQFSTGASLTDKDGGTVDEPGSADADTLRAARFSVETFGLLPMLQRFAESASQARFVARTPEFLDKFIVKIGGRDWFVYADRSHLIRQVEFEGKAFQFGDYRSISGLQLPLFERVLLGDRLIFEMIFSSIEINSSFAPDHFSPSALFKR